MACETRVVRNECLWWIRIQEGQGKSLRKWGCCLGSVLISWSRVTSSRHSWTWSAVLKGWLLRHGMWGPSCFLPVPLEACPRECPGNCPGLHWIAANPGFSLRLLSPSLALLYCNYDLNSRQLWRTLPSVLVSKNSSSFLKGLMSSPLLPTLESRDSPRLRCAFHSRITGTLPGYLPPEPSLLPSSVTQAGPCLVLCCLFSLFVLHPASGITVFKKPHLFDQYKQSIIREYTWRKREMERLWTIMNTWGAEREHQRVEK